jgi:hypothetical protein
LIALAVCVFAPLGIARGQAPNQAPARTYPSIPGAIEVPPAWLAADKDVPFDLKAFFAMPPANQNAAPLYLDALFEFGGDVIGCFAPGPDTDARHQKAMDRSNRARPLIEALSDPARVDRQAIASILPEYQEGFRKLEKAQARPRCVFATGIGVDSLLPHVQATRQVAWVTSLAVLPDLDQGRVEPAIVNATAVLRMARDLQPRGAIITQLVSTAVTNVVTDNMIRPALDNPRTTAAQCDKLISLLANHQKQGIDPRTESLKGEYLLMRVLLHDLPDPQARDRLFKQFNELLGDSQEDMAAIKVAMDSATPEDYAKATAALDRAFRDLLAAAKLPEVERTPKTVAILESFPKDNGPERLVVALLSGLRTLLKGPSVGDPHTLLEAKLHGLQSLAAVRRWQVAHKAPPKDLATACREARLNPLPTDPYTKDQPMKYAVIDGAPVVYSVGRDGQDDGGRVDSVRNTRPGDLISRLGPTTGQR